MGGLDTTLLLGFAFLVILVFLALVPCVFTVIQILLLGSINSLVDFESEKLGYVIWKTPDLIHGMC